MWEKDRLVQNILNFGTRWRL